MRDLLVRIAANLVGNVVAQVAITAAIAAGLLIINEYVVPWREHPGLLMLFSTLFWMLTVLAGIVWFQSHRKGREKRAVKIATAMMATDTTMLTWIRRRGVRNVGQSVEELRSATTLLLSHMCEALAYRRKIDEKGATFLVLLSDDTDAKLGLFAHFHHDDPSIAVEIRANLRRDMGLAGTAISSGNCIVLKNCTKPDNGTTWHPTKVPPRFLGRAAIKVGDKDGEIGALCFDISPAFSLSEEDQKILKSFADRIAMLCRSWGELSGSDGSMSRIRAAVY